MDTFRCTGTLDKCMHTHSYQKEAATVGYIVALVGQCQYLGGFLGDFVLSRNKKKLSGNHYTIQPGFIALSPVPD